MRLLRPLLVAASLASLPLSAVAAEFRTIAGHFDLPDDFELLDRDESSSDDGRPGALYVFKRKADVLPRAVYILTFAQPAPTDGSRIASPAEAAAMMADPGNPAPDPGKSRPTRIGEADAMRHQVRLGNGLQSITYVADHDGLRLLALLKHPGRREYKRDTERFEAALAGFAWAPVRMPAAAPAPQSADPTTAPERPAAGADPGE